MIDSDLLNICWGKSGSDVEQCRPVAEQLRRNGTWLVPTLLKAAEVGARDVEGGPSTRSQPLLKRFKGQMDSVVAKPGLILRGNWLTGPGGVVLKRDVDSIGVLRLMQRVGMPILAGSDQAGDGFGLQTELAMLVAEGLTPLAALQSATLNPAKMWHATDSLGTVAPGKLADLVLLDADPLADITNVMLIRAVVANGRYFDRVALDQLLADFGVTSEQCAQTAADPQRDRGAC